MMNTTAKILIGTAAALALFRSSKSSAATEEETSDDAEIEEMPLAATGFQATIDEAYELDLLERRPVDLGPFESLEPTCGQFYQAQRGDTWLGSHVRSITYRAIFRSAFIAATEAKADAPKAVAQRLANNPAVRKALFVLCVSQQFGDEVYGTYLTSTRDAVGPHGRGIPLSRCCADNRLRIMAGEAVIRTIPRGQPENRGLGIPNRKKKSGTPIGSIKMTRPFLWLSLINPRELLAGRVTTRGMRWEDGSTTLEPPPAVVRLGIAVIK